MRQTFLFLTLGGVLWADDAADLNNLGAQLFASGQYRAAEAPLARAVELWSSAPARSEDLEAALHNLAAVYLAEGRFAAAEPLYQRAIELRQVRTRAQDLSLLSPLDGFALLYLEWGKSARSNEVVNRAISIAAAHQDEQTAEAASGFASLGGLLIAQGRYSDATRWLSRALTIREHLFGADSVGVADVLLDLALVSRREHRYDDAARMYRTTLRIYQQTPDASKRAFVMRCLAEILASRHNYPEAEQWLEKAEAILDPSGAGASAVELGRVYSSRADLRAAQKRYEQAVTLYRKALDLLEPAFGAENPRLLATLESYARALRAREDYATAAGVDIRTMKIRVALALRGDVNPARAQRPAWDLALPAVDHSPPSRAALCAELRECDALLPNVQ